MASDTKAMVSKAKVTIIAIISILILILVLQNTEAVTTKFFFGEFRMPRAFLLALTFLLGGIAGFVLAIVKVRKKPGKADTEA